MTGALTIALAVLVTVALATAIPVRAAHYRRGTWVPIAGARNAALAATLTLVAAGGPDHTYIRLVAVASAIIYAGIETAGWLDLTKAAQPGRHSLHGVSG